MDEYIDIVTATGEPTGKTALKSEAHKNGWYHNTIHLWLYTKNGEILLQQRSHKKAIHPPQQRRQRAYLLVQHILGA